MNPLDKTVGIVVLSWNRRARLIECIARLERLQGRGTTNTIIVVDNGSTDGSLDAIAAAFPDVVLLPQTQNLGFVGGVNVGLTEAGRRNLDFAWLVNDDTDFDDAVLAKLIDFATRHPDHGVYSPVILDAPHGTGLPQFANGVMDWQRATLRQFSTAKEFAGLVHGGATPVLLGTALLCDVHAVSKIGLFEPRFFAYWEDIDFTVRSARAGYSCSVVPDAVVLHDAPDWFNRPPHVHYYMLRNEALFWTLHAAAHGARWRRAWLARCLEWLGKNRALRQPAHVAACVDAMWHALNGQWGERATHRPAPRWFHALTTRRPLLLEQLVRGQYRQIGRRLARPGG